MEDPADVVDILGGGDNQENQTKQVRFGKDTVANLDLSDAHVTPESLEDAIKAGATRRSSLYLKGEAFRRTGKSDEALECFLASLKGLTESNTFHELPQCLHEISDIYFEKNEYEKAVYFIQAEKMYYETALIDIVTFQKQMREKRKLALEEVSDTQSQQSIELTEDEKTSHLDVLKGVEYENLAKLCIKEKKLQLAMDYCGKATKIYRETLGDEHAKTISTLDLFTSIYADVGKKLYEDAMEKFESEEPKQNQKEEEKSDSSGLRNRFSQHTTKNEEEWQEASTEYEPAALPSEQDDYITTILLMLLFFFVTLFIGLLISYFYCRLTDKSTFCHELKGDITYWFMKIRHIYHYYIRGVRR